MSAPAAAGALDADDSLLFTQQPLHSAIIDPSTADASIVVFDRELPLEVRHSSDQDSSLGTLLTVKVKILVLYRENNQPESVRVELARDADLFFHMYHSLQEKGFAAMQARQKLMVDYTDYPHCLITNFNKCIKDPHNCMAVIYIHDDGNARMDFVQNLEFKFVELLSLDFLLTPNDVVKQHIVYRYFNMKAQNDMLRARLQDVNEIVKAKSPSLLLAIKKTPLRQTQQLASTTPSSTVQARAKSPSASGNGFSSTAKRLR